MKTNGGKGRVQECEGSLVQWMEEGLYLRYRGGVIFRQRGETLSR